MDAEDLGRLTYLVLLIAALGGWMLVEFRQRLGQSLRLAAAWVLIFIGLMAGYGLWQDIRTDLSPVQQVTADGVELPRAEDGHYYATLDINGTPVFFMADTGATNIVLSQADARSLGIDPDGLLYLGEAATANGTVRTARVTLDTVTLGPFTDHDVPAWVNEGEMEGSLLGMDYLGRFRISISGQTMQLHR